MRLRGRLVGIALLALLVTVGSSIGQPWSLDEETRRQQIEDERERARLQTQHVRLLMQIGVDLSQPDTDSDQWRALAPDLGIWLFPGEFGVVRGRLYIKRDNEWSPVAIDGFGEIAPGPLPASDSNPQLNRTVTPFAGRKGRAHSSTRR